MSEELGEDTFRYHREHGAQIFRKATKADLEELAKKGWVDSPAKLEEIQVTPPVKTDEIRRSAPIKTDEIRVPGKQKSKKKSRKR